MKKTLLAITALSLASTAFASTKAKATKRVKKTDIEVENFSKKAGNIYYSPYIKSALGYDTNSNRATSGNKENGAFAEALIGTDFFMQPFTGLTLNTNFEIGYREAFEDNRTSGLILGSDSGMAELGLDYDLNDKTTFSLVNEASVQIDNLEDARDNQDSNSQQFWNNNLFFQVQREITEDTGITAKAGLETKRDLKDESLGQEYDTTYLGVTLDHQLNGKTVISPFLNYSDKEWKAGESNDAETTEFGLQATYMLSDQINVSGFVSYFDMEFEDDVAKAGADDEEDGLNYGLTLNHTVTEKLYHSISLKKDTRASSIGNANASDEISANYNLYYTINQDLKVNTGVRWFNGEDQTASGVKGEDYDIYSYTLGSTYNLTAKQSIDLSYNYEDKQSNLDTEYDRHFIQLGYTYKF
ncbi:hypothetical protein LNTAR_25520 [Lentisphaera araneosa HTCC2155]|uniref:Uncharacterized protein n=1 Tax=Lentisphaera araneosa HTCC2155 TaxID=313628 RepID=A6DSE6_9BACT|nr:hypothetical protein [Lentisphaera araneosa]EDM25491.1 hypothetical protein LNTAR_25520 [Lentisphaera araneosa HTCC2155]